MENKQTAVEWFNQQLVDRQNGNSDSRSRDVIFEQANEMFQKQIEEAYNQDLYGGLSGDRKYENGSDYFTKNYQNGK